MESEGIGMVDHCEVWRYSLEETIKVTRELVLRLRS